MFLKFYMFSDMMRTMYWFPSRHRPIDTIAELEKSGDPPHTMPQTNAHHFQYICHFSIATPTSNNEHSTAYENIRNSRYTFFIVRQNTHPFLAMSGTTARPAAPSRWIHTIHRIAVKKENKCPTRDSLSAQKPCRLYPSQHHAPSSDHTPSSPPYGFRCYAAQVINCHRVSSTSLPTWII